VMDGVIGQQDGGTFPGLNEWAEAT
jgi:hypothetical protein